MKKIINKLDFNEEINDIPRDKIRELIYTIFDLEINIKKNINNSTNLIRNFILDKSKLNINN